MLSAHQIWYRMVFRVQKYQSGLWNDRRAASYPWSQSTRTKLKKRNMHVANRCWSFMHGSKQFLWLTHYGCSHTCIDQVEPRKFQPVSERNIVFYYHMKLQNIGAKLKYYCKQLFRLKKLIILLADGLFNWALSVIIAQYWRWRPCNWGLKLSLESQSMLCMSVPVKSGW